ncbi:MAG: glycosyltransferase family 4 protein [Pseudomonadota bacterium]
MKLLFVHQNMPGQYREMMAWLLEQDQGHELAFLTQRKNFPAPEGITKILYQPRHAPAQDAWGLSKVWEEATGTGFGAVEALARHQKETGFKPDLVIGHTGWGEMLFLKELWPDVPVLGFFEYFYNMQGGSVGFDPEEPVSPHTPFLLKARNATPYANLHCVDRLTAPTQWQADCFPPAFHDNMYVCHDGIRTDLLRPDPNVSLSLGRAGQITRDDEIFTYVARNMERMRGFHVFMRALPKILAERPNARVLIIGGNDSSYGPKAKDKGGFRAELEKEVGTKIDWDRVHFLGQVPYSSFQQVVQISRCHIYLTKPFVLSWSLLESMSMEAPIVASDVAPVREAVTHGETGMLVDFFKPEALAEQVVDVLARPDAYEGMRKAARAHVVKTYDFKTVCLPRHIAEMNALVPASAGHIQI